MNLNTIKKFAQEMRRDFMAQVGSRLEFVLSHDDEYLRAHAEEKRAIIEMEKAKGRDALVEEAAYLWFNRLAAFRYMDARGYTSPRIVSPRSGESQPELLSEIKAGRVPDGLSQHKPRFDALLSGRIRSNQPDREVYKEALLGTCNAWADAMPWLFAKVEDWAGLLLPQDILSPASLVARMVSGLSDEDCSQGVEIIGWLYQFYISEKKDEVFTALKKNVKITKENIPAATQLFTPHWIVRFMVENSLGRLWLLNHPESGLRGRMKYFVESDPEPEFLKVNDPTELKCLDPCCGSGHILAYFFELLYAIYEEEGYAPQEIPSLIVKHNIYGIDIDERAAELAAFTLAMVAREKDKRFFERGVVPNVIAMRDIDIDLRKLNVRLSPGLQESLELLKEGRNYGSLIPVPEGSGEEIAEVESALASHKLDDLFGTAERDELATAFRILEYLEPRYHVVVTNPPYMGTGNANTTLKTFVTKNYPDSKSDLFAVFMERCLSALRSRGYMGMINQQSWMFLSSFEALRKKLLEEDTIVVMAHLGAGAFETIGGEVVQTTTFVLKKSLTKNFKGSYVRLVEEKNSELQQRKIEEASLNKNCEWISRADQYDFKKIPGYPITYWLSSKVVKMFDSPKKISSYKLTAGIMTTDNDRFVRFWHEIKLDSIEFNCKDTKYFARTLKKKWFPFNKGGGQKKWWGLNELVVNWADDGREIKEQVCTNYPYLKGNYSFVIRGSDLFFKGGLTWSALSSIAFSIRKSVCGAIMATKGPVLLAPFEEELLILAFLNSNVALHLLAAISPTLDFLAGPIGKLPIPTVNHEQYSSVSYRTSSNVSIAKSDWDLRETSWDFLRFPLLTNYNASRIETVIDENLTDWSWPSTYKPGGVINLAEQTKSFKNHWTTLFLELHKNEEENNRIFIDLYGLQDELNPDVPYSEITILQEELVESARKEGRIEFDECVLARQFVSYGVGCLVGRYSVEKDGLILADSGATLEDFKGEVPNAGFLPDPDGILPLTDEDDFPDDLPSRFKTWLRFVSGLHYEDNLRWIEERLGKDLRTYFTRDFYKDHLKRYKNRPIYWMLSSPSGAFRALIYLHRYTKDSVGKALNDYMHPYRTKLDQKMRGLLGTLDSSSSSPSEKTRAKKRFAQLEKYQAELDQWEKSALYPTALARIDLDLDDGVKVNYRKLSAILEPVKQLEAKEEE